MSQPVPADYVADFSPLAQAELVLHVIEEAVPPRRHPLSAFLRRVFRSMRSSPDWNDREAEQAWATMRDARRDTSPGTVVRFLEEKFAHDHLRKFEYAFQAGCLTELDLDNATILDMGGASSYSTVVPVLLRLPNTRLWSLDVQDHEGASRPGIRYINGDCANSGLPAGSIDVVLLISALEHVGLGRYGDPMDPQGDILAMREAYRILKAGGHLVLTVPYGFPTVVFNLHRVYDAGRLSILTEGFETIRMEYSLLGRLCRREDVENQRVTKHIPGFYVDLPEDQRIPEAPGGVLALLRKK